MKNVKIKLSVLAITVVTIVTFAIGLSALAVDSIYEQANLGATAAINEAFGTVDTEVIPGEKDPFLDFLFSVINQILTFIGIIFFLLLIYTGFLWMNARGNEEQVTKAKKMVQEVTIGLIIIILAKIITQFILSQIAGAI